MDQPSFTFSTPYNTAQADRRRNSPTSHAAAYPLDASVLHQQEYAEPWDGHTLFPVTTGYVGMASTTPTTNGIPVTTIPLPSTGAYPQAFAPFGTKFDLDT
jgi:hypothetical protein